MTARFGKGIAAQRREVMSRSGLVTGWELSASARSVKEEPGSWKRSDGLNLAVFGEFTEEVSGAIKFDFLIYPEEKLDAQRMKIQYVGSFLRCKPILHAAVTLSPLHFQAIVSAAIAGTLGSLHVTCEKLRYGSGPISSMMLSTSKVIDGNAASLKGSA